MYGKETTEYVKVPDEEANKDLPEGEERKMKTVPETKEGYERINNQKPIWLRSPTVDKLRMKSTKSFTSPPSGPRTMIP